MNSLVEKQKAISTLAEAFQEIFKTFKRFIYLSSIGDYIIVSLYVLLSYCYHEMDSLPYLYLYGPLDTGKGEVLNLFKILGFNPKYIIRISDAAIKRVLKKKKFFLLDEADVLERPRGHFMLSIFLNGYKVGGNVSICAKGEDDVIDYPVFGPKVFATTAWIKNPALLSRCIVIRMMVPDREKRPQKFHLAVEGNALKALAERIRDLFDKTDIRQRTMHAYLNLEEIEGVWGRAEEIVSGMRAIANVIGKEVDSDILHDRLVKIAKKYVEDRKSEDLFGNPDIQVIAAVAIFVKARKLDQDPKSFIIAEKLRNNVARRLHLSSTFRIETLGKILRDYYLLKGDPRVKWVPWKIKKIQKTCYFIDYARLNKIMASYEKLIDPPESKPRRWDSLLQCYVESDFLKPKEWDDLEDEENLKEEDSHDEDL